MILAVGNVKGGVGKTTLAVNLAIHLALINRDVLLVDGDEQQTAQAFKKLRDDTGKGQCKYTSITLQGALIRSQVNQLAAKYDDIIIDVGGRDTGSFRAALTVAEVVLIPVKPRSFDLWSVDQTADLITEARAVNPTLRAVALINEADSQGKDNDNAARQLSEIEGLELAPAIIGRRKAFPNAAAEGLSALEYNDPKAKAELTALTDFLFVYRSDSRMTSYGNR